MPDQFTELYVEGDPNVVRGFVAGCVYGANAGHAAFYNLDWGIADDGWARQMAEWLSLTQSICHVLVAERLRRLLVAAIEQEGPRLGLKLHGQRAVSAAEFSFSWEVYSREEGGRARRLFEEARPSSITLSGYEPEEIVDEHGDEGGMYAPVHAYTARASGKARGVPDDLIMWASMLRQDPFIHVERIELEYAGGLSRRH